MTGANDPFADALETYQRTRRGSYRYTRDDGWSQIEDVWWYFTSFRDFPSIEKRALRFARGHVLDIGCGAGRHSLYLKRKGLLVTAMDISPRVAMLARSRGVRGVFVASACDSLPFESERFDTILLFGNNLGLCGSIHETAILLQELARVTSAKGRILATTRAPGTKKEGDLRYWNRKLAEGHGFGETGFKLEYRRRNAEWVRLLLISAGDLMRLAIENGWIVRQLIGRGDREEGYAVILEKQIVRDELTV